MLIRSIIILLRLYEGEDITQGLKPLQLAGLVDDNGKVTPKGEVIILDILDKIRSVL